MIFLNSWISSCLLRALWSRYILFVLEWSNHTISKYLYIINNNYLSWKSNKLNIHIELCPLNRDVNNLSPYTIGYIYIYKYLQK
jgi:hypothetical protein